MGAGAGPFMPFGAPSRLKELQQIVRGADELPFRLHFLQSAQQKSAETLAPLSICPKTGSTTALRNL